MEESIANSSEDRQRLLALKDNQQALLAEHFKTKVSISDPSVGKKEKEKKTDRRLLFMKRL